MSLAIPPAVSALIGLLSRLPGIGEKTAQRLAFHILKSSGSYARELAEALISVADNVGYCSICANITDEERCSICSSSGRDGGLLCVVESVPDLLAVERTGEYRGMYHVLHGVLSPLDGIGPSDLQIGPLIERIGAGGVEEVIMAVNPDIEGEATSLYIHRLIGSAVKVTRIAQGVPMGGDIEYSDQVTLGRAIAARIPM